jgi:hypothetical protein
MCSSSWIMLVILLCCRRTILILYSSNRLPLRHPRLLLLPPLGTRCDSLSVSSTVGLLRCCPPVWILLSLPTRILVCLGRHLFHLHPPVGSGEDNTSSSSAAIAPLLVSDFKCVLD